MEGVLFNFPATICNIGNYCDEVTGTCQAAKPAGEACESDTDCASGNCDFATEMCSDAEECTN